MKNITIVAEDRIGLLADISYILGKAGINIEALSVDVVGKKAIVALTVKDARYASDMLLKSGYNAAELDSIVVKIPNQPSEMSKIATLLSNEGINIENMHNLTVDANYGIVSLVVDKPRKARRLLGEHLIHKEGNGGNGYEV